MIGMFLPLQCIMIPLAVLVRDLHISNTLWAVIVPYIAFNIPFAVMVIYGYMRSLPYELEESACIDGASLWTCFYKGHRAERQIRYFHGRDIRVHECVERVQSGSGASQP